MKNFDLGSTIRDIRRQHSLTLDQLALQINMSKGALSKIETNKVSPPVATLIKIASAMNVHIGAFFSKGSDESNTIFVPQKKRRQIGTQNVPMKMQALCVDGSFPNRMLPIYVTIKRTQNPPPRTHHPGEEFLHILRGKMTYAVGQEEFNVGPGDSLYFRSSVPHGPLRLDSSRVELLSISVENGATHR